MKYKQFLELPIGTVLKFKYDTHWAFDVKIADDLILTVEDIEGDNFFTDIGDQSTIDELSFLEYYKIAAKSYQEMWKNKKRGEDNGNA